METLGYINDREILYQEHDLDMNWSKYLPDSIWLLAAFVEIHDITILDEIAGMVIDKDICYACCIGTYGDKLHDLIDDNLVIRRIDKLYLPNHLVMTTWHNDITEGLWFAAYAAFHEGAPIPKIFCLDVGMNSHRDKVLDLIDKFNKGFLPDDE